MAAIKQLAGQTMWYGLSSVGARMLNYLLTPLLSYLMNDATGVRDYGNYSIIYAWIGILNIVFTYGFETGYFRFVNLPEVNKKSLFQTTFGSLLVTSSIFVAILTLFRVPINDFLGLKDHTEYIIWIAIIIGLDALSSIPFAKLRQEGRPKKYAFIKLSGIVFNIFFVLVFLVFIPKYIQHNPDSIVGNWFSEQSRIGLLILANLIQSVCVFFFLFKEWDSFRFKINIPLWKEIFKYSSPMIVIGLAGMVNEMVDRQMLASFLPGTPDEAKRTVGIYSMNYKLGILISLFIQAFKMAAEPFFFNQANNKNAPEVYAKVMKWFVIFLSFAFLFTAMYLDILQFMIGDSYRSGLYLVPIFLMANIFLGIYYNLSVWYKITNKMRMGTYITVIGAIITISGNYLLIPIMGMYASAIVTLSCYGVMMIMAYFIGQKHYPVPYEVKKIMIFICSIAVLYGFQLIIIYFTSDFDQLRQVIIRCLFGSIWILIFCVIVYQIMKEELAIIPVIKKFIK